MYNTPFEDFYRLLIEVMDSMVYIDKNKFIEYNSLLTGIFNEEICAELFDKSKLRGMTNQEMLYKMMNKTNKYFQKTEEERKKQIDTIKEQKVQIDTTTIENKQLQKKIF